MLAQNVEGSITYTAGQNPYTTNGKVKGRERLNYDYLKDAPVAVAVSFTAIELPPEDREHFPIDFGYELC